jgi:hypothetical protein
MSQASDKLRDFQKINDPEEGESTQVIGYPLHGNPATRPYIGYFFIWNSLTFRAYPKNPGKEWGALP